MNTKPDHTDLAESTARWQWAGLILAAMFIGMFPIYRVYEPAQRADARVAQQGFLAAQGEEIYFAECSTCHGVEGRGGLGPAIGSRNFLESVDDHQISQLTVLGIPGTEMVAYSIDWGGPMTSEEIEAITAYLRSLEEDSESNPNWQTPLVDHDLAGEQLYALACSRCHGVDRAGVEDLGLDISETSYTLDESDEWIADRINNGRNEMPRFGRVLTDEQVNMLIAFLRGVEYVAAPPTTEPPTTEPTTDTTEPPTETTEPPDGQSADVLALGQEVWDVTAGGEGCANCHGFDAKGGPGGPDVRGGSKSSIVGSIGGGTPDMEHIVLTDEELDAVYEYLKFLSTQ
jgi:mono/diheme cytochrome c family protein